MTEPVFFLTISLPLLTILLIFGMKYFAATQQAKARQEREEAYRQLALSGSQAQQETASALRAALAAVEGLNVRMAEIERILKQVE